MFFQVRADLIQFLVRLGHGFFKRGHVFVLFVLGGLVQRSGRSYARDHVLALSIDQPFAVEFIFTGRGIARECHASGGSLTHVSENHRLHSDRGAPFIGNALDPAVGDRPLAVPALKNRADSAPELFDRDRRGKAFPSTSRTFALKISTNFFRSSAVRSVSCCVAFFTLHGGHFMFELHADAPAFQGFDTGGFFHDHIRIHHDQPAIGVVGETLVTGFLNQSLDRLAGQTDVQDGFHHSRHGTAGAGSDGHEKRIRGVAEFGTHDFFHFKHGQPDLFIQFDRIFLAVLIKIGANIRGDRKARRYRNSKVGHLRQVGALSSQQFFHLRFSVGLASTEGINEFRHTETSLNLNCIVCYR